MARDPVDDIANELTGRSVAIAPQRRLVKPRAGIIGSGSRAAPDEARRLTSRRLIVDDGGVGLGQIENLRAEGVFKDEVENYIERKERATEGPSGERLDDFYTFVQMKQNNKQDLKEDAQFARTNPPSILQGFLGKNIPAFSASTNPGQGFGYGTGSGANPGFDLPTAIVNSQQVASWSGPDEECTDVVCTFGQFSNANIIAGSAIMRPYGIVQWGVNGQLSAAIVDICRGTMFMISASTVMLSVGMESLEGGHALPIGGVNNIMNIGAYLSFHPINRTSPVTRTIYSNPNFTTTSTVIFVPPFAKKASLLIAGSATALTIDLCNQTSAFTPGPGSGQFLLASGQTNVLNMPIPNDCSAFSITKTAGADIPGCLIFELGLG